MIAATLTCPECGASMVLRAARQGRFAGRPFYGCATFPLCRAAHGAHPDGKPLGIPGDAATKAARCRAHDAFDLIWKTGMMSRKGAYAWMRWRLGLADEEGHIGRFDVATCERLLTVLATLRLDDPRTAAMRHAVKLELAWRFGWGTRWWATVADILGVEEPVYLIELTAVQCEQVIMRLASSHDRMRHGEHGGGEMIAS